MSIILFPVLLLARSLNGLPVFIQEASTISTPASLSLSPRHTGGCVDQRTVWTIIWSCLVTIFACTWTAVHPNIPGPSDSGWVRLKRRIVVMVYALVAPEMIATWAMRQYFGARLIMNDYNSTIAKTSQPTNGSALESIKQYFSGPPPFKQGVTPPWTMTQAFFVQMGGVMLCEDGVPVQILDYPRLKHQIEQKVVDIPRITNAEVQDRSKGDFISKGVVLVHTTWFVVECIARWRGNLPLSELEVVTLGFALLNAITYGLWWNKPQNVLTAIRIEPKIVEGKYRSVEAQTQPAILQDSNDKMHAPHLDEKDQVRSAIYQATKESVKTSRHPASTKRLNENPSLVERISRDPPGFFNTKWTAWIWHTLFTIPLAFVGILLHPFIKMMHVENRVEDGALRVPMFYTGHVSQENELTAVQIIAPGIAGALFGGIHLIPWSFHFASWPEQLLWRISALITLVEPLGIVASHALDEFLTGTCYSKLVYVAIAPTVLVLPFYFIARFVLLAEAFLTLRNLPLAAFQNISWTTMIPHLQT